jgi:toxin ParE1/3/4
MLPIRITSLAWADIIHAYDWYENILPDLGTRFNEEVAAAILRIRAKPLLTAPMFKNVRRLLLRRFPYALFFHVEPEVIHVIACFHGSRDPKIWQSRA